MGMRHEPQFLRERYFASALYARIPLLRDCFTLLRTQDGGRHAPCGLINIYFLALYSYPSGRDDAM